MYVFVLCVRGAIFQDSLSSLQTSHHQRPAEISKTLKPLRSQPNLNLASDFTFVDEAGRGVNTKVGTFYAATYGDNKVPVTLLLSSTGPPAGISASSPFHQLKNGASLQEQQAHNDHSQQSEPRSAFSLCPVTKFIDDSIPSRLIPNAGTTGNKMLTLTFNQIQLMIIF